MHRLRSSLRLEILLDDPQLVRWQQEVIECLEEIKGVEICRLGLTQPASRTAESSAPSWWYRRFVLSRSAALQPVGRATFRALPSGGASVPDVALYLGRGRPAVRSAEEPPLGVWHLRFGSGDPSRPCCWEVAEHQAITAVALERLAADPADDADLTTAVFPTIPHSFRRNLDQAALGSVQLPAQLCAAIIAGQEPPTGSTYTCRAVDRRAGSLKLLSGLAISWVRRQFRGLTLSDRWHVGVIRRPIESMVSNASTADAQWLDRPSGKDRYVADPFGCPSATGLTILVEDFDHAERHGRISAFRFDDRGRHGQPQLVRDFPTHASYPYLVEVQGDWWCIPETAAANEVRAYRFDPDSLTFDEIGVLLAGVALSDPTLFRWEGRWWLFGTDFRQGPNTHLRAWWATEPTGPWTPHAIDPLAIDVRGARGAGTPFLHDGQLHRPAQDCSTSYGGAVSIRRIDRLDPNGFSETEVARLEPDPNGPYPNGVHTLSAAGDLTLIDGTLHRFSLASFTHELIARASSAARR